MLLDKALQFKDFSGGHITASPLNISNTQTPNCLNVYSGVFKTLLKRKGYSKLNSASGAATGNSIYNYVKDDSTQKLMSLWGTTLKKMDISGTAWDGTWDTISVANYGTALTGNPMFNTSFNGDCIITTNDRDVPQKYDPSDASGAHTNLDWQTSHCYVVGDVDAVTPNPLVTKSYLKITIDGTAFDDVDLDGDTSIADVVASINAHSGLSAKGFAVEDSNGYLRIYSNTRGATGSVVVADGTNDNQEACEILFDGTTSTGTTIGTNIAPQGRVCLSWHDYVWIANTSANPDRVYYSSSSDHTTWSATDYQTIITPGDVGITALAELHGRMYVFKQFSIHRITYLGGTPLLEVREVKSGIGTTSPKSVVNVEVPGEGEVIIFLGSDLQLYKFDGYSTFPIGEPITQYNSISTYCLKGDGSTYGLNPGALSAVHAVDHSDRHQYILFFCLDNDTVPKDAYIYDYFSGAFWPCNFNDTFNASCSSDNGAGRRVTYVIGTNYAWLYDNTNADDGNDISAYWDSAKIDGGTEVALKNFGYLTISTKSVACTPIISVRSDWDSSYTALTTLTTATNKHVRDIPRMDNLLQIRIADDSSDAAFEIYRMSLSMRLSGEGT